MEKTKILLAEDHLVVRNGIKLLLDAQANFEVVADVGSGREILDWIAAGVEADILITDLTMDNVDVLQMIKELTQRGIKMNVIVLSMLDEEHYVAQSSQYRARAYLVKNVTAYEMLFFINH